jgi:DNA-directed RNA polymerase subunit RPC12/RpoP
MEALVCTNCGEVLDGEIWDLIKSSSCPHCGHKLIKFDD